MDLSRTEMMLGAQAICTLQNKHVALFGLGGVGGACLEGLVRAGVGHITVFDNDTVSKSNLNRQLLALQSTVGQLKTSVAIAHAKDLNPNVEIIAHNVFYDANNQMDFPMGAFDYVIDAIDTVSSKLLIVENAKKAGTPIIMCLGTGNKLDPTRFRITPIKQTHTCPLAKVMRRELGVRGFCDIPALWSDETPHKPAQPIKENGRYIPGSVSFVPPVAGFCIVAHVVKELLQL